MPKAKKLPSGSWRVQVYSHTEYVDGKPKRIRQTFTAPTKAEAEYQAIMFKRGNKQRQSSDLTLGKAMQGYIDSKDGILSPATIRGYNSIKKHHLLDLQQKQLYRIKNVDIQIAINQERKNKNWSAKTTKNVAGFVSAAIGLYREDFNFKITLPQKELRDYHLPTWDEITALLDYTKGSDLWTAVLLASCLGLRRGEICALKWSDFDWKQKTVRINKATVQSDDGWSTKNPKSYAGYRTLSISDGLISELQSIRSKGPVITVSPAVLSNQFARAVKHLGFEHFRFHDLRHFNASMMMSEGIPDKYAIERMGHSTTAILRTVYQHTDSNKRSEIDKIMNDRIDSFLGSKSTDMHTNVHTKMKKPRKIGENQELIAGLEPATY